jgi:hypothetical protein
VDWGALVAEAEVGSGMSFLVLDLYNHSGAPNITNTCPQEPETFLILYYLLGALGKGWVVLASLSLSLLFCFVLFFFLHVF